MTMGQKLRTEFSLRCKWFLQGKEKPSCVLSVVPRGEYDDVCAAENPFYLRKYVNNPVT